VLHSAETTVFWVLMRGGRRCGRPSQALDGPRRILVPGSPRPWSVLILSKCIRVATYALSTR
jgi:hypothetical protein